MIETADTFLARFRGLMGRRELASGHALLLEGCSSVHMFFMKFALDIVYLDRDFRVLYVETLRPWQIGSRLGSSAAPGRSVSMPRAFSSRRRAAAASALASLPV